MKVKIKKLHPEAKVPTYAKEGDAGLDLVATSMKLDPGFTEYGVGLAVEIPVGHVGLIFPRSSISAKDQQLANSVGVIDSGYRGEIKLRFVDRGPLAYEVGDKIAQLVVLPYPKVEVEEVSELSSTDRGDGGFGSTGK